MHHCAQPLRFPLRHASGRGLCGVVGCSVTFRLLVHNAYEVSIHELTPRIFSSRLRSRRLWSPKPLQHARSPVPRHHSGGGFRASHRHRHVSWRRHRGTCLGTFEVVRGAAAWRPTSACTGRGPVRCRASGANHVWHSDAPCCTGPGPVPIRAPVEQAALSGSAVMKNGPSAMMAASVSPSGTTMRPITSDRCPQAQRPYPSPLGPRWSTTG